MNISNINTEGTARFNAAAAVRDYTAVPADLFSVDELRNFLRADQIEEDSLLMALFVPAAIQACEAYTGIGVIPLETTAVITNMLGGMQLPYGPVAADADIVWKDTSGNVLTTPPNLDAPTPTRYVAAYTSGYEVMPPEFKLAVLQYIAYMYEHRGDEPENPGHLPAFKRLKKYRVVL